MSLPEEPYPPSSITLQTFRETPEEFQKTVIRLMSIQAYAEKVAAIGIPNWSRKTPGFRALRTIGRIIADEARHAFLLYAELENLGVSESEADAIATGKESGSDSLDGPGSLDDDANGWFDMVMNHMFLDRAGKVMVGNWTQTSYGPWAAACEKILADEDMHVAFGQTEFKHLCEEHRDDPDFARVVTRWFVAGLNFFGPPPGRGQKMLERYGIKRKNNDVMREEFRVEVMGILEQMGRADLIKVGQNSYPYQSGFPDPVAAAGNQP